MEILDLKKELKYLNASAKKGCMLVEVPPLNFIMLDGQGNPNTSSSYSDAVQALYTAAYTLKFMVKKELGVDYPVMPLEGLWWMEDMREFSESRKEDWKWTMMILQPEIVTPTLFSRAVEQALRKKGQAALSRLRLECLVEGCPAQILYIGPYAEEGPTIALLYQFIQKNGYLNSGKHHEVYLGDPRRSAPEKLRTLIRQPMHKA